MASNPSPQAQYRNMLKHVFKPTHQVKLPAEVWAGLMLGASTHAWGKGREGVAQPRWWGGDVKRLGDSC